jgi:hypothetical protein
MRFQVVTVASAKMAVPGCVPCSFVENNRRFRGAYSRPYDGGSVHL